MNPGEKRTSWVEDIFNSPYRVASAPYCSMTSSGSIPVPRLFDILRPSGASTSEWMITSWNGMAPELLARHHHPHHPEEDDVAGRRDDVRG